MHLLQCETHYELTAGLSITSSTSLCELAKCTIFSFFLPLSPLRLKARPGHLVLDDLKLPLISLLLSLPMLYHHLSSFLPSYPHSPPPSLSSRLIFRSAPLLYEGSSSLSLNSSPLSLTLPCSYRHSRAVNHQATAERPFHTGSLILHQDSRRGRSGGRDAMTSQRMSLEEKKVRGYRAEMERKSKR